MDKSHSFSTLPGEFENIWNDTDVFVPHNASPGSSAKRTNKICRSGTANPRTKRNRTVLSNVNGEIDRKKTTLLWKFLAHSAYLPDGSSFLLSDSTSRPPLASPAECHRRSCGSLAGRRRLLCDEVGMGKTIEAIMAIRSLLGGRGVRRVLFLLPAGLTLQWQEELREKGGLIVPRLKNANTLVWPDGSVEQLDSLYDALDQDMLIMSQS